MNKNKLAELENILKDTLMTEDISSAINIIKQENIDLNSFKLDNKKIISWMLTNFYELVDSDIEIFKNNIISLHNLGLNLNQTSLEENESIWFLDILIMQNAELSKKFLNASIPEDRPWKSYQAFLYTCQDGSPYSTLLDILKDKHIDVEDTNDQNENALFFAASQTDKLAEQRIFTLLHKGLDPNSKNKMGETPIFYSLNNGSVRGTKILLTANADPNICDIEGNTPLHNVVITDNYTETEINDLKAKVMLFIEAGANLNIKNKAGLKVSENPYFSDWLKWMLPLEEKVKMEADFKDDFSKRVYSKKAMKY